MRALAVLVAIGSVAAADPTPRDTARSRYAQGSKLYDAGRYREAAHLFGEAYALQPIPALLFNEGQAWYHDYERTGDRESARQASALYRRYLTTPNLPRADRDTAVDQLSRIERALPDLAAIPITSEPPPDNNHLAAPPPSEEPPSRKGLFIGLGVGAAVVIVALVAIGLGVGLSGPGGPPTVVARW